MCLIKRKIKVSEKGLSYINNLPKVLGVFKDTVGAFCIYSYHFSGKFQVDKNTNEKIPCVYVLDDDDKAKKRTLYWRLIPLNHPTLCHNFSFVMWFPEEKSHDAFVCVAKLNTKEK